MSKEFVMDTKVAIAELKNNVKKFVEDRDWRKYHLPKNLSMAIAAEAAELMELLLWVESKDSLAQVENKREAVEDEVADIFCYLLQFCNECNIDLSSALENKLQKNAQKYPVEKAKGSAKKYTEL